MSGRILTVKELIQQLLNMPWDAMVVAAVRDGTGAEAGIGGVEGGGWEAWTDFHGRAHPTHGEFKPNSTNGSKAVYLWTVD